MIPSSELIINPDNSIYHLNLQSHQIADTIITVGDPERVPSVSKFFDKIEFKIHKREFITHTGLHKGKRISVISTGMGTDNIEVLMTELDALVNVDFKTRKIKENLTSLNIIRVGTSGSLQESIPVGTLLASQNAVGMDTLMQFYRLEQSQKEQEISEQIKQNAQVGFNPYVVSADESLLHHFTENSNIVKGNTLTCPGFYAPQGREVRLKPQTDNYLEKIRNKITDFPLTNMEMETAGYYALSRLLGHKMLSLNAILANRITHQFSENPQREVDNLIEYTLNKVVSL
ncbi:nucleoside phosphorylase [Bernardetia sp.]|uniref:nucleoside phosphorylase n=1 Tax=Bernardetia sp. TaxID=1937974 RepID=UPI0025C11DF2|nr:nucleoside phosphorylase [Bernardetia sp.]